MPQGAVPECTLCEAEAAAAAKQPGRFGNHQEWIRAQAAENGNDHIVDWCYIGIMEKEMATTISSIGVI